MGLVGPLLESHRATLTLTLLIGALWGPAIVLFYWTLIRRNRLQHERFQADLKRYQHETAKTTEDLRHISEARLEDLEWIRHELQWHRDALAKFQRQNTRQAKRIHILEQEIIKLGGKIPDWVDDPMGDPEDGA